MSVAEPVDDDGFTVYLPPPGLRVDLRTFDDALDFVLLLQPRDEAVVALLDDLRHVLLVVETHPRHLPEVAPMAQRIDGVAAAVVFTAHPVCEAPSEDALMGWQRLRARFDTWGLALVDWLHVDDELVRSLAETSGLADPWSIW
ncbi:MAG TPA: hypothetical protein VJM33_14725 [Microthrixaceae bacterium]|nr:hypothetical protein [Microthrixaceae bacterium]